MEKKDVRVNWKTLHLQILRDEALVNCNQGILNKQKSLLIWPNHPRNFVFEYSDLSFGLIQSLNTSYTCITIMGVEQEGGLGSWGMAQVCLSHPHTHTFVHTPTYNVQMRIPKIASFQQSNITSCVHITYQSNPVADIRGRGSLPIKFARV
jgi:hypothetical protein